MSPPIKSQDVAPSALQLLYGPVHDELQEVEAMLRQHMRSRYEFVDELVRYGCLLGGKRLRPALLLLAAKAVGHVSRDHLVLATVVEMIHTATLVHDDVLDEATMRRHLATVNARWDNECSVLLGDFLFTHSFYLASTLDSTQACRLIGRATNIVCEGEIRQKGSRANFRLSEEEYLEIISAKTAELCACCCRLGAMYAGGDEATAERMASYGRKLGIAFQIADDLLDLQGEEQATGKSLGTDLDKQKPTLPLIRLLATADEEQQVEICGILEGDPRLRANLLQPLLQGSDALAYTRERARQFAAAARRQLAGLPESDALQVLHMMTEAVVSRTR